MCDNTDSGLRLSVDANWEGEDFNFFENYLNASGYNVQLEQFKFYLSDIKLVKEDGSFVELSEIELFDFINDQKSKTFTIPEGNYSGLKYSWGVPVELNGTNNPDFDPLIYDADHPLNLDNAMYWGWSPGYRFVIFEGRYDLTPATTNDIMEGFSIHVGKDTTYYPVSALNIPFNFQQNQNVEINLDVDFSRAFFLNGDTIDLAIEDQSHGNNIDLAISLMDKIANATVHSVE